MYKLNAKSDVRWWYFKYIIKEKEKPSIWPDVSNDVQGRKLFETTDDSNVNGALIWETLIIE